MYILHFFHTSVCECVCNYIVSFLYIELHILLAQEGLTKKIYRFSSNHLKNDW